MRLSLAVLLFSCTAFSSAIVFPTEFQNEWAKYEVGAMISFGMETSAFNISDLGLCTFNTGNNGSWFPPNSHFNPQFIDTDQWAQAISSFGAKYAIFTAKHCSGYALWPTQVPGYNYSVKYSTWNNGTGDLVAQVIKSLSKFGIKIGLYYNVPTNLYLNVLDYQYGAWNESNFQPGQWNVTEDQYFSIVQEQLTELWTNYGELAEVWFDGGTTIPHVVDLLLKYQPNAIAFQGPKSYQNNIRWVGNELANPPYPCWSTADNSTAYGGGDPKGKVWAPAESDTTIRNFDRWFWTADYFSTGLKNLSELFRAYESAVGRNTNLLLNLSPDPYGLVPLEDMIMYKQLGDAVKACYQKSINQTRGTGNNITLNFQRNVTFNRIVIQEDQTFGQRILNYTIHTSSDGRNWHKLSNGTSVGNKRIEVFPTSVTSTMIRLEVVKSVDTPLVSFLGAYQCKKLY